MNLVLHSPLRRFRRRQSAVGRSNSKALSCHPLHSVQSLGSGLWNTDDSVELSVPELTVCVENPPADIYNKNRTITFSNLQSFMRVSDLDLDTESCSCRRSRQPKSDPLDSTTRTCDDDSSRSSNSSASLDPSKSQPLVHYPGCRAGDMKECWVALDATSNENFIETTPIAHRAIQALVQRATTVALFQEQDWNPDSSTVALLRKNEGSWMTNTFDSDAKMVLHQEDAKHEPTLVWSRYLKDVTTGSDLPVIRAASILPNITAYEMAKLLLDDARAQEYNPACLERVTSREYSTSADSTTKRITTTSQPIKHTTVTVTNLIHCEPLKIYESKIDGKSQPEEEQDYIIVTRSLHDDNHTSSAEVLLSVTILRNLSNKSCIIVTVNHMISSMLPKLLAHRLGMTAAKQFIGQLQDWCHRRPHTGK